MHYWSFLKEKPGLLILVVLLLWISTSSVYPEFYLIGWDNYSSYLGGGESLWRTLFSTWRAYRGLGVPGDSESVDIVRQVIILGLSPFVPEPLRDQMYIMVCLWIGVVSLYILAVQLLRRYSQAKGKFIDISAAIAAGSYLFNLNTLSTFYFPIITYITRFASLPLLFLLCDQIMYAKKLSKKTVLLFILGVFFSLGSFLTATIFITTTVALSMYIFTQGNWRRGIVAVGLFFALNAFWLLPFANYTIEKSSALRLAPVFVDTNEIQLNQSPSSYSLIKQLALYPNFFKTRYTVIDTAEYIPFHPAALFVETPMGKAALSLFPWAAIAGVAILMVKWRIYKRLLWVPAVYIGFLLLSSQEYSWLGFIPAFLNKIPYFQVVFRFGDTKFHPYIAFAGSLAAGVFAIWVLTVLRRTKRGVIIGSTILFIFLLFIPAISVFRWYFIGDFLPKHLFVTLPDAYRKVAQIINRDTTDGRVLHLPYDPELYWRSHSWGYMGSAFFQYMLTKPYFDKTFEPASLEMTDYYRELTAIIRDANQVTGEGVDDRVSRLSALLEKSNVTWVVFDDTVVPELPIRNMRYWGTYNTTDSSVMMQALEDAGRIEKIIQEPVDLAQIGSGYRTKAQDVPQASLTTDYVSLYRVKRVNHGITFQDSSIALDPGLSRVAGIPWADTPVRQQATSSMVIYPLLYKDSVVRSSSNGFEFTHDIPSVGTSASLRLDPGNTFGNVVNVSVQKERDDMIVRLYHQPFPTLNAHKEQLLIQAFYIPLNTLGKYGKIEEQSDDYRSNWHILGARDYGPLRISVDGIVLPVEPLEDDIEHMVGSVLVTSVKPTIALMRSLPDVEIYPDQFVLTDEPNCFGDRTEGYEYQKRDEASMTLTSRNGSTCLIYPFAEFEKEVNHIEVRLQYRAHANDDTDDVPETAFSKPRITSYVLSQPKPNQLSLCLQGTGIQGCANTHQMLGLEEEGSIVLPTEFNGSMPSHLRLALIPVGKQEQELTIFGGVVHRYTNIAEFPFTIPISSFTSDITLSSDALTVSLPYVLSRGSYYYNVHDGMFISNGLCEQTGGYRTTRMTQGGMIGYLEQCYNELSVQLPFDSRLPKIWTASYAVYSGKYPRFVLTDSFSHYLNEYMSLYQGYPSVPGMLLLQQPQQWYRPYSNQSIAAIFDTPPAVMTYASVASTPELTDARDKLYTIHQDSQNEGIVGMYGQNIIEFPAGWERIGLYAGNTNSTYAHVTKHTTQYMLPSLTKVTVMEGTGDNGKRLLMQSVGFNRQWQAYPDLVSLLIGTNGTTPDRCDGLYNCYELPAGQQEYYLFYTPERLAMLGWLVTIGSIFCFAFLRRNISRV